MLAQRIAEDHHTFFIDPGASWGTSEWMINYSAGFVRRGLGGAVLGEVLRLTGIRFFPFWVVAGTLSFAGLCAYVLRITWRMRGPGLWRLALLLNPILLITACHYGTYARKDLVFVWATLLNVAVCGQMLANARRSVAWRAVILLLTFAGCGTVLALLHEGLLPFSWLPINLAVCAYALRQLGLRRRTVALLLVLGMAPAGAAVAGAALHHGNAQMARTICESWQSAAPVKCQEEEQMPPEVERLGWSLPRGIALAAPIAPMFPLYPVLLILAGGLEILAIRILMPAARLEHLLATLLLAFVASLPLYVLGVDWGRWLALTGMCSLLVMLSERMRPACYRCLPALMRRAVDRMTPSAERFLGAMRRTFERDFGLFCAALLLLEVPPIPVGIVEFLNPSLVWLMQLALHLGSR
ncbi:MAG: hypothetical protein WBG54_15200 [Acidobacteriaceae bacterium]